MIETSKLESTVSPLFEEKDTGEKRRFEIMVSLTEAFNNAIRHGNKMDTTKSVVLETGVFGSYFWARITDQGLGFDSSKLPDPLKNENITKQNGRGVFLIEKLSTAFSYKKNRSGYHVNMLFDLNKVNL